MAELNRVDPDYYKELYALQDRVLSLVFSTEQEFYLTGGTCLSRFYREKRYSDDLDFFSNNSPRFAFAVRNIISALKESMEVERRVETKNFTRLVVDHRMQVDFVNDLSYRLGEPHLSPEGYLIDGVDNILANKLTAVVGRDNPKDVFDIILIHSFYQILWQEILTAAHKKAAFTDEELIVRLKSFPPQLLNEIRPADPAFLEDFDLRIAEVIRIISQL